MAWRVDEVDEVLEAVADVEERDGAALHGDATLLVKKVCVHHHQYRRPS